MLLIPASTMILTAVLGAASPQERGAPPGPTALTACTLFTGDEIKAALGRTELITPRRVTSLPNGGTDCRFFGQGRGDVRILLDPPNANEDFALRGRILKEEGAKVQPVEGLGSGAYYWDDRLQVFAGTRTVTLWVNRTEKTESAEKVREALIALGKKAVERLRR